MASRRPYAFAPLAARDRGEEEEGGRRGRQPAAAPASKRQQYTFAASSSSSSSSEEEDAPSAAAAAAAEEEEVGHSSSNDEEEDEEAREKYYKQRRRLPELDFVLTFAHRRARAMLRVSADGEEDEDEDVTLKRVLATWLEDVQHRFEQFEKQASKFDELESAVLQSQRKHQLTRRKIALAVADLASLQRQLDEQRAESARRTTGLRESNKSAQLLHMFKS